MRIAIVSLAVLLFSSPAKAQPSPIIASGLWGQIALNGGPVVWSGSITTPAPSAGTMSISIVKSFGGTYTIVAVGTGVWGSATGIWPSPSLTAPQIAILPASIAMSTGWTLYLK